MKYKCKTGACSGFVPFDDSHECPTPAGGAIREWQWTLRLDTLVVNNLSETQLENAHLWNTAIVKVVPEAALTQALKERDAYAKAKAENDERFMLERDQALAQVEEFKREHAAFCESAQEKTDKDFAVVREAAERARDERDQLKRERDAARAEVQLCSSFATVDALSRELTEFRAKLERAEAELVLEKDAKYNIGILLDQAKTSHYNAFEKWQNSMAREIELEKQLTAERERAERAEKQMRENMQLAVDERKKSQVLVEAAKKIRLEYDYGGSLNADREALPYIHGLKDLHEALKAHAGEGEG